MARTKKHEENLRKVQDMLDGNSTGKLQVGMHTSKNVHEGRKVGDIWEDSDGVKWEQKEGYRSKVSNLPPVGMFPHQCKDCKKNCNNTRLDKETYNRMDRCYHCQINWEVDMKSHKNRIGEKNNKHYSLLLYLLYLPKAVKNEFLISQTHLNYSWIW